MSPDGLIHTRLPEPLPECVDKLAARFREEPAAWRDQLRSQALIIEELFVAAASGVSRYTSLEAQYVECVIPEEQLSNLCLQETFDSDDLVNIGDPRWHLDWLRILIVVLGGVDNVNPHEL